MGRHYSYREGSFYRTDDRSGFPQRAEHTRKQWDNLIVDESLWEPRQPQDLVRGVRDDQSVTDPRPLAPDSFVGPTWTTTDANAAVGATSISLTDPSSFANGYTVTVMMDNGILLRTTVDSVSGTGIVIAAPLSYITSSGAQVWNYGAL